MRENLLFVMVFGLLLLGFLSHTLTGAAPRGTIIDRYSKISGAGYDRVGDREYLVSRGVRTDILGGPSRAGYSILFGNFPFPEGKGDLDRDGKITKNDFFILQTLMQRGSDVRTPLEKKGYRYEYTYDSSIASANSRTTGYYDEAGDIDDDGAITYRDVVILQRALNPYLGVKTSLLSDYKEMSKCLQLGAQTCAVDRRDQIGTCKELLKGGTQYGFMAYAWEDCPIEHSCVVKGHGRAACVRDVNRQAVA